MGTDWNSVSENVKRHFETALEYLKKGMPHTAIGSICEAIDLITKKSSLNKSREKTILKITNIIQAVYLNDGKGEIIRKLNEAIKEMKKERTEY